jgi:uncharacterized membrane protein
MTTTTQPRDLVDLRERIVLAAGAGVGGLILLSFLHAVINEHLLRAGQNDVWLALHLSSVLPAIPMGAYVLLRRKGDRLHRMLGRTWGLLMLMAALSSFGLHGLNGGLSWIHILSIIVIVMIPRGALQAMRHNVRAHRRTMTFTYLGLVGAGVFTMLPGRLLGAWLLG